ncbi:MAG: hypothetical protein NT163_04390 [Chlorobiales bacterium]|nr:hypothetical protein [Chlorobiales bacterium]
MQGPFASAPDKSGLCSSLVSLAQHALLKHLHQSYPDYRMESARQAIYASLPAGLS